MTGTGFAAGAPLGGSPAARAAGPNHGVSGTSRSAEIHKTSWKRRPSGYRLNSSGNRGCVWSSVAKLGQDSPKAAVDFHSISMF